jgi:hypothetical protein
MVTGPFLRLLDDFDASIWARFGDAVVAVHLPQSAWSGCRPFGGWGHCGVQLAHTHTSELLENP